MIKERLGLLISGSGTTMEQMIQACQNREVIMDVGCVIASNEQAKGLIKAHNLGIPTEVVNPSLFRGEDKKIDQEGFGKELLKKLQKYDISVVTQNGWLPLTPENVINRYHHMIFNQHPGPVPEFGGKGMYGIRVHAARLELYKQIRRDPITVAIAQRVAPNFDEGAVVEAGFVKILENDTPDSLQKRVLPVEHQIQIELLKRISWGRVRELKNLPKFVKPHEQNILNYAKKKAIQLYPNG